MLDTGRNLLSFGLAVLPYMRRRHARAVLLTGSAGARKRREALAAIRNGSAGLVVGTHALIQDEVEFRRLVLAVVDEQHRFGVEQRSALRGGPDGATAPHLLVMTATPIPRSLALTAYGDLDLSLIDELPPGRAGITTRMLVGRARDEAFARARVEIAAGRQVFVTGLARGGSTPVPVAGGGAFGARRRAFRSRSASPGQHAPPTLCRPAPGPAGERRRSRDGDDGLGRPDAPDRLAAIRRAAGGRHRAGRGLGGRGARPLELRPGDGAGARGGPRHPLRSRPGGRHLAVAEVRLDGQPAALVIAETERGLVVGRTATGPIHAGELLVARDLGEGPSIGPGEVAVTVSVETDAVYPLLRRGDAVAVLGTADPGQPGSRTETLLSRARRAGSRSAGATRMACRPTSRSWCPGEAAERVAHALVNWEVTLVLLARAEPGEAP